MWKMIRKYLPREAQIQQFNDLESKGTEHGKHFSLYPLVDAIVIFIENCKTIWKNDQQPADHWNKVIGGAQKLLPAHVVNEYCYEIVNLTLAPPLPKRNCPVENL